MRSTQFTRCAHRGFSLVELMVALALGLLLVIAMTYVYVSGKTAFTRQQQLSALQQSVRVAFEYLTYDTRIAGHMGCYSGNALQQPTFNPLTTTPNVATNFVAGIEGYEYGNSSPNAYALGSNAPGNVAEPSNWQPNASLNGINM